MKMLKRLGATVAAVAMLIAGIASANAATTADASVQITAGTALTASIQNASLGPVQYSFTNQTASGTLTLGARDDRGTAVGWTVTLKASAANFVGVGNATYTIPVSGLAIVSNGTITTNAGNPTVTGQSRPGIAAVSSASAATIWSAAALSGDGDYSLASTANLVVPGGTRVETYKVTLEVGITSGP
jgi:hypothetical protein